MVSCGHSTGECSIVLTPLWPAAERDALIHALTLLKRNALAAPFERAFALQKRMEESPVEEGAKDSRGEVMAVHYR